MKSKARRILEGWASGKERIPHYLGDGQVFVFPSQSGESTHHTVARIVRKTPKRSYTEWVCSCRGFGFSHEDVCQHVTQLKREFAQAMLEIIGGPDPDQQTIAKTR